MSARLRSSTRASTVASESLADQVETKTSKGEGRTRAASARAPKANELARLARIATFAFLFSLFIIGGTIYFALHDTLRLYPNTVKPESLKGFNSRAEFSLRYQTLLYLWLIFNINAVIYVRLTKKALNPLFESTEKLCAMQKNILTNSFEQIMVSSFLQLAFASFADPTTFLKLIPAVNIVQFIGRIAFFLGYPWYRTFGISLTLTPNLLMLCYNLYKFGAYLNFY